MLNQNMITINNSNYTVICSNELKQELNENIVNWYNFERCDIYYDNIGNEYIVSFIDTDKRIIILEQKN